MKVLAVIGSPRKRGNTFHVVDQIKAKLQELDQALEFEYLFLEEHNLRMCTGCFLCISHGAEKCPLKDDRDVIAAKMSEADGIIFAAPTYAKGVSGLMKNFIDRFAYTCHRPEFFHKVFLAVTTIGGSMGMRLALEQLSILAGGGKVVKKLGVSMPPIPMVGYKNKSEKSIQKAAWAFYGALSKGQPKLPSFSDWGWFHSFRALCAFPAYQKACPADYAYYSEKQEYFYPLDGHFLRRLLGKLIGSIMWLSFRLIIKNEENTTPNTLL